MTDIISQKFTEITNASTDERERIEKILLLEEAIKNAPGGLYGNTDAIAPIANYFCPGVYVRQMFIPKGYVLTGKIHLHDHLCMLVSGHLLVSSVEGTVELKGFNVFNSGPGVKRAGYALEDSIFLNILKNEDDEHDIDKLEERYVVSTFEEYAARNCLLPHEKSEALSWHSD